MKSNQVSILVVLVLCLAMGGFLYIMDRSSDEVMGWNPSEMYGELGVRSYEGSSFSDVTFSGGGNSDGVAVSMRNGSFSLRTRAFRASSLTPNNPIASSSNNLPSLQGGAGGRLSSPNSLIGHMTSNAEFHSFGGGSNMTMGSYTSSSNNLIAPSPAIGSYSQSPIAYNPIASSPNNLIAYSPSNGDVQVAAEQTLLSVSSSASGLFVGSAFDGYATAEYNEYLGSAPSRVNNRFNAPPGTSGEEGDDDGSAYESWLRWLEKFGSYYGTTGEGGALEFDNEGAWNAFLAWYQANYGVPYDENNSITPPEFTYKQWLAWFTSNGGTHNYGGNTYKFTPVGDVLPLIVMALLYMIILLVKRNKTAQL